ncbi:MAG: hypothetical protein ACQEVT_11695 [Pseudomonadota bacterium]|uniref:hypothetical protein n=1 Tax=Roseovarius TaxID=74030 RepID=UPI0022A6D7A0|nr:hypothetical protein [Roseovarius sp. EGI FJ00037]MCZ0810991.1 hypothetical protein [Roseovarius sp. EGI FJ00037]
MKRVLFLTCALMAAGTAHAQDPKLIGCFQKVHVPAQYDVKKIKIKDAERKYVKRNGRIELIEYAPVFREEKTLLKEAYEVMQEIPCD